MIDTSKYIIELVIAFILLSVSFAAGFYTEHTRWNKSLVLTDAAVAQQIASAVQENKVLKENADVSQKIAVESIKSIDNWYRQHPVTVVRLQHDQPLCSPMPEADHSAEIIIDTSQSGIPSTRTVYIDDYNPIEVEKMANQLNQLIKLLKLDGVNEQ
jgi:hypothetical protein